MFSFYSGDDSLGKRMWVVRLNVSLICSDVVHYIYIYIYIFFFQWTCSCTGDEPSLHCCSLFTTHLGKVHSFMNSLELISYLISFIGFVINFILKGLQLLQKLKTIHNNNYYYKIILTFKECFKNTSITKYAYARTSSYHSSSPKYMSLYTLLNQQDRPYNR